MKKTKSQKITVKNINFRCFFEVFLIPNINKNQSFNFYNPPLSLPA